MNSWLKESDRELVLKFEPKEGREEKRREASRVKGFVGPPVVIAVSLAAVASHTNTNTNTNTEDKHAKMLCCCLLSAFAFQLEATRALVGSKLFVCLSMGIVCQFGWDDEVDDLVRVQRWHSSQLNVESQTKLWTLVKVEAEVRLKWGGRRGQT